MSYVGGFVLSVPKKNLAAYVRMAQMAGRVWREHGALECRACAGDDLDTKGIVGFPKTIKLRRGETMVFAFIVYNSRAHRDRVSAKVMKNPRLAKFIEGKRMPVDHKRMVYGGFTIPVDAWRCAATACRATIDMLTLRPTHDEEE